MVNDPKYDALYEAYVQAADPKEAARISREADRYIIEQHWLVTAGESYSSFNTTHPWVKGWAGESIFWGCQTWLSRIWVDQGLKK